MNDLSGPGTPPPGCPAHNGGRPAPDAATRIPLYGPEFAARPQEFYEAMRAYGPAAPVELAPGVEATLVTDYAAALQVLQNPDVFTRDSRRWRALEDGTIPPDSPVLGMMGYRPNVLFTDGAEHLRLRQTIADSLTRIDAYRVGRHVERVSAYLADQFKHKGTVDLLNDYAKPLTFLVFNELFGASAEVGDRLIRGFTGIFDGVDAETANQELAESLLQLVAQKRARPGDDITSWMMEHPAKLTDEEMLHQITIMMGAGIEPERNLIANGLLLILSDERYFGGLHGGGLLVEDAINEVLWNSPPIANYATHFPVQDTDLAGVKLPAFSPVLISFAGANTDPALSASRQMLSKRAHLAWGAGPHACPVKDSASLVATTAIERLLNEIPDVELAVPADQLEWRPGVFHRALSTLPARFTPVQRQAAAAGAAPAGRASVSGQAGSRAERKGWWSSFLTWWRA
ncbi:cytochrome P450 [Streptomyces marincola]|uniref:cytochrome P450 n=1 Tax=Streptomyces marincola TaxID=2878388 RepID=UPI001CF13162|nr:cytochrome P450 [Streptomyces marincola]UCM91282.1 cytochrome P450 [Streptomyces marincola]